VENLFVCTGFIVVNFPIIKFHRMKKAASLEHVESKLYQILHKSDEKYRKYGKNSIKNLK